MRRIASTVTIVVLLFPTFTLQPAIASESKTISVMTRNIYLGADVGVALDLLPDFPAAAQFMWDQMRATDFEERSKALVKELALYRPDIVGVQEATKWICKKGIFSRKRTVFDFLQILIEESKRQGVPYSLAKKDGKSAFNTGFSIPAIPRLTVVKDPELFPVIFGRERASCGFEIADAILIRDDFNGEITQVGNSEFSDYYTIVPGVMEIYRGYSWVDLDVGGQIVRIVTTHLESLFDEDSEPQSSIQATQLIEDLASTRSPLVVMGDFNADPRDPRGIGEPNPGGQPRANFSCKEQVVDGFPVKFDSTCNAYWKMIESGYEDVGPDSLNPKNFTWGSAALLDGPEKDRISIASDLGNRYGFTDRLDYILVRNGVSTSTSQLLSNKWPQGSSLWDCALGEEGKKCFPSDHAGVFAQLILESENQPLINDPLLENQIIPWARIGVVTALGLTIVLLLWLPYRFILRPLVILPLGQKFKK